MSSALVRRTPVMAICCRAASRIISSVVAVIVLLGTTLGPMCPCNKSCCSVAQMSAVPADLAEAEFGLADIIEESMLLLGAGSTVLYQLALIGVGRGVAEHSTTLARPLDRLRTTLTYVYVMTQGTQQERDAVARMVNKMHAPVRGEGYTAFDRDLQLWVAAT